MQKSLAPAASLSRLLFVTTLVATSTLASTAHARVGTAQPDPRASSYDAGVLTAWFDLALSLTKTTAGFSPPVASRAFGYLGVTAYESVVRGIPSHRSLAGQLNALTSVPRPTGRAYHWAAVANAALAEIARDMYTIGTAQSVANRQTIDALEAQLAAGFTDQAPADRLAASAQYGRDVASAIYAWSRSDGGDQGYLRNFPTDYTMPTGPGMWVPTPPAMSRPLQPYWGNNRPFVLPSGESCATAAPLTYSEDASSQFYAQAYEVYETVNTLTPAQRETALYWSDDPGVTATPPGHSVSIATQVLRQQGMRLADAAEVYARVGIAVADAFIACWNTKYRYTTERPITYIPAMIDPTWGAAMPLTTPPFPEYVSGHSTQSAAAAQVLTAIFGPLPFTDTTNVSRGFPPRSFADFFAFAEEAAISRLYGGIHFRRAIEEGLIQGRCVGGAVNRLDMGRPGE